jgi:hypothetical protein
MAAHQPELGQISDVILGKVRSRGCAALPTFTTLAAFTAFAPLASVLGELDGR